jgi:hypothetical protein
VYSKLPLLAKEGKTQEAKGPRCSSLENQRVPRVPFQWLLEGEVWKQPQKIIT